MRGGVIAFAGIAAIAGGLILAAAFLKPEARATAAGASVARAATSRAGDRVFLTQAQLDQAIASGTLDRPVKSLLAVKAPLHFGDYAWDDRGIPAGPTWIRVDLGSQLMSVFRGANEIGTAVIVYGGDNKQTPSGKLHILGKARDHRSSLYDAQMPYTLRLTNDGVSIHASSVRWGAATHGCIGIPLPFAQRLFDAAAIGDEVVIVGGAPAKKAT
jgi:hypothetical protein